VIVIITLLFAAGALVAFIERASTDLTIETREAAARRLREVAYSALEVTLAVLHDFQQVDNGLRSPAEGWDDPLGFAGWTPPDGCEVEVSFEDESGKLSLPHVEAATLLELFKSWGLEQSDAQRLTDALLGWMRKDYVPETTRSPDYDRASPPYAAPLRPLRSYSELAAIDYAREVFYDEQGRPNDLWHRFVAAISLYDFKASNVNSAPGDVLTSLGMLNPSQQQQISNYLAGAGDRARLGPSYFDSAQQVAALVGAGTLPAGFGTTISALRINITVHQGRTAFHLSTVIAPPDGAKVVHETAVSTSLTDSSEKSPDAARPASGRNAAASKDNPPTAGSTRGADAPKLNYPFTLLEIRENAELSAVPPTPPATPE
jgi:general secretion pathway protein K